MEAVPGAPTPDVLKELKGLLVSVFSMEEEDDAKTPSAQAQP